MAGDYGRRSFGLWRFWSRLAEFMQPYRCDQFVGQWWLVTSRWIWFTTSCSKNSVPGPSHPNSHGRWDQHQMPCHGPSWTFSEIGLHRQPSDSCVQVHWLFSSCCCVGMKPAGSIWTNGGFLTEHWTLDGSSEVTIIVHHDFNCLPLIADAYNNSMKALIDSQMQWILSLRHHLVSFLQLEAHPKVFPESELCRNGKEAHIHPEKR